MFRFQGLATVLLAASAAFGQSQFGAIRGIISDAAGAVVTGAEVQATNEKTQVGFSTVSSETGDFLVAGLLPGLYSITVKKAGFREVRVTGLVVTAGATERKDISLEVGDITQRVTVTAEGARLETQSGAISAQIPTRYMERPATLFYGAVLPASSYMTQALGVSYGGGQDLIAYGSRAKDNRQVLDGAVLNADGSTGGVRIPRRSILELDVSLMNGGAEYATTTTASMFTVKGTNQLHGEVWTEIGNAALSATPWYAPGRGPNTPDVRMGFKVTGPVVIPKIYNGRNRTFFHASLERYQPQFRFPYAITLPSDRMKSGDLRELGRDVRDPLTGQPFPNNTIPANRIHPVTRATFDRFYPSFSGAFAPNNFSTLEAISQSQLDWFVRLDQAIGSKNNLSFTYARNRFDQDNPIFGGLLSQGRARTNQSLNFFNISDVHVVTPSIVNEANFGFRFGPRQSAESDVFGASVNQALGLPVPAGAPTDVKGGPRINVPGITSVLFNTQSVSDARFWTFRDNVSWIKGRLTSKFGIEVINPGSSTTTFGDIFGSYNFTGFATTQGFGDFLLGIPFTTARALPFGLSSRVHKLIGVFVQEEFRVNRALTLTFGGRFQYNTTPIGEQGRMYNFDVATGNLVLRDAEAVGRLNPGLRADIRNKIVVNSGQFPDRLVNPMRQFFPRFGLALQVRNGTVFRGGYSIFGIQQNFGPPVGGGPFQAGVEDFTNRLTCADGNVNCTPAFTFSNPFPQGAAAIRAVGGFGVAGVVPDMRFPLTHQANATIEQRLPASLVFRTSYILTRGSHLSYRRNINLPPASTIPFSQSRLVYPPWTAVNLTETGANTTYHAWEAMLERRFSGGLAANGGYTLAKCLTDSDEFDGVAGGLAYLGSIGSSGMFAENPYNRSRDRGNCHSNPRHTFKGTFALDLPFGSQRKFMNKRDSAGAVVLDTIFGGWTVSGFFIGQTGRFYTPYWQGFDAAGTGQTDIRPDRIASGRVANQDYTRIFDPTAFVRPEAGRYGNAGRGIIEGIGGARMDAGIYKNIPFAAGERVPSLRIGIQSIDIFNVQPKGTFGRTAYIVTNPRTIVGRADAYFFDGPNSYNFGSFRTIKFEVAVQF
jgi:hypothetical protein